MDINVPNRLDTSNALDFILALSKLGEYEEYVFNFEKLDWTPPFGMLLVANAINDYRKKRPDSEFVAILGEENSYPANMGFYKTFGANFGKAPGELSGNQRYLPINIIDTEYFFSQFSKSKNEPGEIIEEEAQKLAIILTQQNSKSEVVLLLTYAIREMLRNIFEHSCGSRLAYCGQFYPKTGIAEIAILDNGIGIKKSIEKNPFLVDINSDVDAINFSLLPGVSGKMYRGIKKDKDNVWQNSGYGLFVVSQLCAKDGNFVICSGSGVVNLRNNQKINLGSSFEGTALCLKLNVEKLSQDKNVISKIVSNGDELSKEIMGEYQIKASQASKMLRMSIRN